MFDRVAKILIPYSFLFICFIGFSAYSFGQPLKKVKKQIRGLWETDIEQSRELGACSPEKFEKMVSRFQEQYDKNTLEFQRKGKLISRLYPKDKELEIHTADWWLEELPLEDGQPKMPEDFPGREQMMKQGYGIGLVVNESGHDDKMVILEFSRNRMIIADVGCPMVLVRRDN